MITFYFNFLILHCITSSGDNPQDLLDKFIGGGKVSLPHSAPAPAPQQPIANPQTKPAAPAPVIKQIAAPQIAHVPTNISAAPAMIQVAPQSEEEEEDEEIIPATAQINHPQPVQVAHPQHVAQKIEETDEEEDEEEDDFEEDEE